MFTPDNTALSTLRDMMGLLQIELNERRQEVSDYREENAVLKEQNAQLREKISRIEGERVHPEQTRSYGVYARRRWWWPFG